MMNPEQRRLAEKHVGLANFLARKYGGQDDEWKSVATHAMCIAVIAWTPAQSSIETWVSRCVRNAIFQVRRSKQYSQEQLDEAAAGQIQAKRPGPCIDQLIDRLTVHPDLARAYWIDKLSAKALAEQEGITIRSLNAKLERLRRLLEVLMDDCAELNP